MVTILLGKTARKIGNHEKFIPLYSKDIHFHFLLFEMLRSVGIVHNFLVGFYGSDFITPTIE